MKTKKVIMDGSFLKSIQEKEAQILRATVEICEKLNLKYYLLGGTLLGAVRHGGFIPWDDDIDIGMPRQDYEIFIKESQKYYPGGYFVQHYSTEPNLPISWCKIRDSRTAFMESTIRNVKINKGVFIDVFPLDFYPDDKTEQKKLARRDKHFRLATAKAYASIGGIKQKLAKIKNIITTFYLPYRIAVQKRDELHKSVKSGKLIANYNGAWGAREIVPGEWYGDGCMLEFEGIMCRVPKEYDKWLTQVYGDYMQLPPPESRVSHHFVEAIDANKSYTYYER